MKSIFPFARYGVCVLLAAALVGCASSSSRGALEQGQALLNAGRLAEAYQSLNTASREHPQDASLRAAADQAVSRYAALLHKRGDEAAAAGQRDLAHGFYEQLAELPGQDARASEAIARLRAGVVPTVASAAPTPVAVPVPVARVSSPSPVNAEAVVQASAPAVVPVMPPATAASAAAPVVEAPVFSSPVGTQAVSARETSSAPASTAQVEVQPKAAAVQPDIFAEVLNKKVSLEFRDAEIRAVFESITRASGLNIVFDRDVSQEMQTTIYLRNTSIRAALDKLAMINNLAWRQLDEHTLLVYMDEATKQRDYQRLVVHSFHLSSAEAKTVANSLRTVLKFRDMVIDEKLNMIVVRDTPEAIELAEKLVAMHDVADPEVMLEVEILEVKRSLLQDLGIKWPGSATLTPLGSLNSSTDASGATTTAASQLTLRDMMQLTPGRLGVTIDSLGVKAQKNDSDINLLANPRIRTRNREKAKILIGERVPNISSTATSTGFVSENIAYVDVGLKLDVEPQIYPNGEVAIKLVLEVSSINESVATKSGTVAYRIGTRTTTTSLRLRDGETQVLGGLIQDNDRKSVSRVPLLGDIPLLGRLFSQHGDDKSKTEIILSITPRVVRGIEPLRGERARFEAGTVSGVRGRRPEGESSGMDASMNGAPVERSQGSERRERDEP